MCGRYASSRKPEDLVEEFEIDKVEVKEPLAPDYNVAPTKQVYAVVQRPTDPDDKTGPSERQLRSVKWGLVPFWAKEPGIGNKMINARMETVHEKPAFRRPFASRRCLLPADGYFEWYPTEEKTKAGKPLKQPFFIRPADGGVLAMAGLYELWKDPTRDADDPLRFLWSCTVITTSAEDSVGHIHDRMPLMVEPERYAAWLDPTNGNSRRPQAASGAGGAGSSGGLPGEHPGQQRPQQRSRARRPSSRLVMTDTLLVSTPHGDARLVRDRSRHPIATLLLGHGAGGGIEALDLAALAAELPRQGVSVVRVEQPWRVAGRRVAPRPQVLDECFVAAANRLRVRTPLVVGGRSAGARSAARTSRELGASGFVALAFPLHPPGRPEKSRLDELELVQVPTLVVQGERDPFGTPEEFPPDRELAVVPGGDHGFKVPKSGPISIEEAMGIVVEAVLEFVIRDVVGNRSNP